MEFRQMFQHGGFYLLPDDTRVRAMLYNMEGLMLEWIFEDLNGVRQLGVAPDGAVLGYVVSGRDQFGLLYELRQTDLTLEDIRPDDLAQEHGQ
jgi:hypothetical protein